MKLTRTKTDNTQNYRITLPHRSFFNLLLGRADFSAREFLQSRYLIIGMVILQLVWLAAILWTGTSSNLSLITFLAVYSLCAGLIALFLPETFISKVRSFKAWLLQSPLRLFLILGLIVLIGGVFYASQQRAWGDEERSLRVARITAAEGVENAYQQNGWLRRKHPPLMPLLYSMTLGFMGDGLFNLRLVSVVFMGATLIITYDLGRELYDRGTGYLAAFLFLLFPLVMRLGTSAMMDTQLTFFFALALLLCLRLVRAPSSWLAVLAGLVIGLGLLTKYIMVLIYGVLIVCILVLPHFRRQARYFVLTGLTSLAVFSIWLIFAGQNGILAGQIDTIMRYSGIYHVATNAGTEIQPEEALPAPVTEEVAESNNLLKSGILRLGLETLFTRLPSSLGVHHLPLMLFAGLFLLKRREASDLFLLFWTGVVFIILFLTLPDHRYFMAAFPAIAIMIARMFSRFPESTERAVLLSLLLLIGNLYLFVDWIREAHLFL
ncbi:MAG TPA: glycosyltransferase family 39 protein [Anaerolineales bacterium]|nr:glycosyltransferase family 39 protein [Anaerolineales bacterium]